MTSIEKAAHLSDKLPQSVKGIHDPLEENIAYQAQSASSSNGISERQAVPQLDEHQCKHQPLLTAKWYPLSSIAFMEYCKELYLRLNQQLEDHRTLKNSLKAYIDLAEQLNFEIKQYEKLQKDPSQPIHKFQDIIHHKSHQLQQLQSLNSTNLNLQTQISNNILSTCEYRAGTIANNKFILTVFEQVYRKELNELLTHCAQTNRSIWQKILSRETMTMRFDEQEEGEDIVETDQMIFYQINEEIEQNIHIVKWEVAELGLENENISRRIERIRGNLNNEMIKWQTMTVRQSINLYEEVNRKIQTCRDLEERKIKMKHEKELFQSKVIETKKQNRIKQDEGNRRQIYLEKLRRERLPVDNQGSEGEREGFNRLQEGSQIQISQQSNDVTESFVLPSFEFGGHSKPSESTLQAGDQMVRTVFVQRKQPLRWCYLVLAIYAILLILYLAGSRL